MLRGESVRALLEPSDTHATYGAFEQQTLVGMVGLLRLTKLKQRHKAMVVGMYVQVACRRHGIGRALINAVIQEARSWSVDQLQLSVTETAVHAKQLYESAGFRAWGTEPRAVHWGEKFFSEHHLALTLSYSA
jgi:GNAT superfamily N-acetyltransferase